MDNLRKLQNYIISEENKSRVDLGLLGSCYNLRLTGTVHTNKGIFDIDNYEGEPRLLILINQETEEKVIVKLTQALEVDICESTIEILSAGTEMTISK